MRHHLAIAAVSMILAATIAAADERPNVVLVITDDQGYGDLACHGNPRLKTPHLDRLHAESIRLTDFHVAPMCTPTRGQLMSGRDCLANGAMNVSSGRTMLRRELPTMANVFAAGGYATGQFGKWHLGDAYPYRPQDRGFDKSLFFPSSHIPSAPDHWNNDYFDPWLQEDGVVSRSTGYVTDVFFGKAMEWISKQAAAKKPFFAYIATNAPHGPLWVPDKYRRPYRSLAPSVASFFAMVANIDENMGRLERFLGEQGLAENTILVFMTDNGGTAGVSIYNAGMRGRKIDLTEGGHRVPCFIRWADGKLLPPGDVGELTECQDLLPTLADLCGIGLPPGAKFDGVSLAPRLRGEVASLRDRTLVIQFSRMDAPRPVKGDACVLWRRFRLIGDKELYDLERDPQQERNVIADHPDTVAAMRSYYDRWWAAVEPQLDRFEPIVIGAEDVGTVLLSPADWRDVFLDQARQIRDGVRKNGTWAVDVARGGTYEFELRRWPREAELPLASDAPPFVGRDGSFPAGAALPIARARLRVGRHQVEQATPPGSVAARFVVDLPKGKTDVQSWFLDSGGAEICGAYYVYVEQKLSLGPNSPTPRGTSMASKLPSASMAAVSTASVSP